MNPDVARACAGQSELFDSTIPMYHEQAKAICGTCPGRIDCEDELRAVIAEYGYSRSSGPRGTWAGKLFAPETVGAEAVA